MPNIEYDRGMTDKADPFPPKFWASEQGLIDLQPLGAVAYDQATLADRLMIAEAFHRFGIAHDENRIDVLLSVMTDDVIFEFSVGSATPTLTRHGREAVRAQLEPRIPLMLGQRRHCITNIVVDALTHDAAKAVAYGIVPLAADGLVLHASVVYSAQLRKEADALWRFSRLFIGVDDFAEHAPPTAPHEPFRPG